jgi:PAS domain S-box-containing protein
MSDRGQVVELDVGDVHDRLGAGERARRLAAATGLPATAGAQLTAAVHSVVKPLQEAGATAVAVAFALDALGADPAILVTVSAAGASDPDFPPEANLRRLVDAAGIERDADAIRVELRQRVPNPPPPLAELRSELADAVPHRPLDECERQHAEIIQLLHELWRREDDVRRMAGELEETNRGVLALYSELDEAAHQWHTTFDSITDGVCLLDASGRIVRVNEAMGRILGVEAPAVLNLTPGEVLQGALGVLDLPELVPAVNRSSVRQSTEVQVGDRWYLLTLDPITVESHAPGGAVLIISDVTEKRRLEEQRRDMERREIEATQLREHARRMRELERMKSDFLNLASHELRGPLSVLRGYLSMIEDGSLGNLSSGMRQVLPVMTAKMREMNILINQMLETARLEDSRLVLNIEPLDLRDVAREAVESMRPLVDAAHRLTLDDGPAPVPVQGDRNRLVTIVTNLIDNGLKYSPAGGEVRVTVSRDDVAARISVADKGLGIDAVDLPRLFTRFGRLVNEDNSHIPGTGLGLYLARELTRMHGGDITAESKRRAGSKFTITLPIRLPAGKRAAEARGGARGAAG